MLRISIWIVSMVALVAAGPMAAAMSAWSNLVEMHRYLYMACDRPEDFVFDCTPIDESLRHLEHVRLLRADIYNEGFVRRPMFEIETSDGDRMFLTPLSAYPQAMTDDEADDRMEHDMQQMFYLTDPRAEHPDWPAGVWEVIGRRAITLGMTAEQVLMAWGKPMHINRTVTAGGIREQWAYGSFGPYVYFENDVVTAWQN